MTLPQLLHASFIGDHSVILPVQDCEFSIKVEEEGATGQHALATSNTSASQLRASASVRRRNV